MLESSPTATCGKCGKELDEDARASTEMRKPCPDCGSTLRLPDGKRAAYQVIFRNFGKGPATDVSICAEVTATVPNWKSYNCDIHTEIVAAPGGEVPIVVTGPAFPDVVKQVYIWGAVKYLDQFSIARHTEYCATPHMTLNSTVAVGPCDHTRAK